MALTVVKRPQGYVIDDTTTLTATVSSSSGALFTRNTHGLTTGDFIYIYSNLSSYNGYWYVSVVGANTFRIREYATASDQPFINSGTVTYYRSANTHGWNCVHLPIIYKLKSDLWPINGVDTARTITTFSNWNGYTYLNLSGDVKSSGNAASLESVVLSGTSVDGAYKIIQWFSDTNFVIDLAYSGSNVLSSGTAQYYYLNYHARIRVYAGLTGTHFWNAQKPYTLIVEKQAFPDSAGVITFNVAEFLKTSLEIASNNTIKDTLPNNLDAFCQFYISYAESYTDSDGYTIDELVSSYTNDTFEGYALNAKLPFKTRSSGAMSEYVSGLTPNTSAKFLTNWARPTIFAGKYWDISFINNSPSSGNYMKIDRYLRGVLQSSTLDVITDQDQGVYRYPVSVVSTEDRIDLTLYSTDYGYPIQLTETKTCDVYQKCSAQDFYLTWQNNLGGFDYWNFNTRKKYILDIEDNKTHDVNWFQTYPNSYGEFADSITKQSVRESRDQINVISQIITVEQNDALLGIPQSLLVQYMVSQYDRRTVLVGSGSVSGGRDGDKRLTVELALSFTDQLPNQSE